VLLALAIPLVQKSTVKPARMRSAEQLFSVVEALNTEAGKLAFVSLDFGPNSMAENLPQAEVVIEHLMRKRIPLALYSQYVLAEPFLNSVPEGVARRLMSERTGERWEYGRDWVNLGFRPNGAIMLQNIAASEDLAELFRTDVRGNRLRDMPAFRGVKSLENIQLLAQFTSLVGTLDTFLQFFQKKSYRPVFVHGCTSITIPQAYIYLDSGQLRGLLEGVAGAAWYSELLNSSYSGRHEGSVQVINTGLGVAHLVIIILVVIGNVAALVSWRSAHGS